MKNEIRPDCVRVVQVGSNTIISSSQWHSKGRICRENTRYSDAVVDAQYNEIVPRLAAARGGLGRIYGHFTTSFNRSLIIVGRLHPQLPIPNS